jgi:hypothetical protein
MFIVMVFVCDRRAGIPGGFFAAGMPQLLTFCGRNAAAPFIFAAGMPQLLTFCGRNAAAPIWLLPTPSFPSC